MIPGCRTPFDERLLLRRLTDEATRTGKEINCQTLADEINATIDDPADHVTANAIHMRLWRLDIPHTMAAPEPKPRHPKAERRPVRRVEYHPAPTSQAASQTDLLELADMHKRAFERLRALEGKVSAIQENTEVYVQNLTEVLADVSIALRSVARDHHDVHLERLIDKIQDIVPRLKHTHVYLWGAQANLPSGVGECACGAVISHPRRGTDNTLYKHSIGSTANRDYGRRGY